MCTCKWLCTPLSLSHIHAHTHTYTHTHTHYSSPALIGVMMVSIVDKYNDISTATKNIVQSMEQNWYTTTLNDVRH